MGMRLSLGGVEVGIRLNLGGAEVEIRLRVWEGLKGE